MKPRQRFFIGGAGALMPVLVSLLAIDIGAMLSQQSTITTGTIVGFFIRYIILFIVGGFIAYLHTDEEKPFKLFEIGIAAPALITSLITAQGISSDFEKTKAQSQASFSISLFSSAHAVSKDEKENIAANSATWFSDVIDGITGKAYVQKKSPPNEPEPPSASSVKETTEPEDNGPTSDNDQKNLKQDH